MDRFHALIFVAGRIRNGAFPRIPNFAYNEEHQKYLYLGRPLTLEEFNEAAETVLDAPEGRYSLSVRLIDSPEELEAKAEAEAKAKAEAEAKAKAEAEAKAKAEAEATKTSGK